MAYLLFAFYFHIERIDLMKKRICILIASLSFLAGAILSALSFLLFLVPKREAFSYARFGGRHNNHRHDLDYEVEHCEDPDAWYGGYEDMEKE